jgi:hypothetical protein
MLFIYLTSSISYTNSITNKIDVSICNGYYNKSICYSIETEYDEFSYRSRICNCGDLYYSNLYYSNCCSLIDIESNIANILE